MCSARPFILAGLCRARGSKIGLVNVKTIGGGDFREACNVFIHADLV